MCKEAIESGKALDKFAEFVEAQGGNKEYIYDTSLLPKAKYIVPVYMNQEGYLASCKNSEVGMVSLILGGGRATKESEIDLAVGVDVRKHLGELISKDEVFAYIHANSEDIIDEAKERLLGAYTVSDEPCQIEQVVKFVVE